jgi:lysophospholipase L1-like esterase
VPWTTSHLAALAGPDQLLPFLPRPLRFRAQTVRQFVRLRRGGERVRLVMSNQYGTAPLRIEHLVLSDPATRTSGVATLAGNTGWEIPAGATATSDPVDLPVDAGGEVAVDCFLPHDTPLGTYLHSAQRTGLVAPGCQVGAHPLTAARPFTSLYWIAQLQVDRPASGPVVIAIGDSITRGDRTSIDADQRYPDHLHRELVGAGTAGAVVLNAGHGGNRLLRPVAGPSLTDRFARDVLAVAEATHVVVLAGTNDIGLPGILDEPVPSPAEIVGGLDALAVRAHRTGIRPVLTTIPPFLASRLASFTAAGTEETRRAVNDALRHQDRWPVADVATALADPSDPTRLAPGYDSGDGIHPSDAGARAIAGAINPHLRWDGRPPTA